MAKKRTTSKRAPTRAATKPTPAARTPKGAARKRRAGAKRAASAPPTVVAGACLDLIAAGEVVQDAIPGGPHDIDSTLEDSGLITASQRAVFRADVVDGVSARGCSIDSGDVPNSATTTLRDARTAVQQNAH